MRTAWPGFACMLAIGVAFAAPGPGNPVTIRVLSTKVMKAPKFIGATAGSLSRGDHLTVREVAGDWYRVDGAAAGWIHKSSVTEGKVTLSAKPGGGGTASREEVELAGRGFTPEVEGRYRSSNPKLDFAHVDRIERLEVDPAELQAFVTEGKLAGGTP